MVKIVFQNVRIDNSECENKHNSQYGKYTVIALY